MNKRTIIHRICTYILVFIMTFMSCYVPDAFAAQNNNGKTGGSNSTKSALLNKDNWIKKDKSNQKTDIIVKYKSIAKRNTAIKDVKSELSMDQMEEKNNIEGQKICIYQIGKNDNLNKVIDELNDDPNIEYAQPNYPLKVMAVPTDDKFSKQWGMYNNGQVVEGHAGRAGVDLNVINAWNLTKGDKDVVIGVLDSGININHKDLKSSIYLNKDEIPGNGIDDDNNGYIDDIHGWDFFNDDAKVYDSASTDTHGTNVAGTIAAASDNGGIVGVAPKVKLLPLKFISGNKGYTSDAIEAIAYAKKMGVKIINCSFGGTDDNPALKDAMKNSGILFVCSAGNNGADTSKKPVYPAAFDISNILSVAAIDSKGIISKYSSYGTKVDIAAPGSDILCTDSDNSYSYCSGTSISAAYVSGIAALAQSYLPDTSISLIKDRIIRTAVPCNALKDKVASGGRADAFAALSGTVQPIDEYTGPGNDSNVLPKDLDNSRDTWYTLNQMASNVERFHYGEGGINPASGNYSVTCTDMTVPAPGFQMEISRTYNSRNQSQTLLGRGWTFGFEGNIINKDDSVEITLPNGSSHVFHNENGTYVGEGTRASYAANVNGVDILTTQDQYKYGFNAGTGKLIYMEDKDGNRINLTYQSGVLTKITDTAGRDYSLAYNDKSLLSSVTDPSGRRVTYEYNKDNLLTKVTDPQGGILTYEYDSAQFLTKLYDQNNHLFQQLAYNHNAGPWENKVIQSTDSDGETWYYTFDMKKRTATITNKQDRTWVYYFDTAMYTIRIDDPQGKSTYTEYDYQDMSTYYGDVKATIDRNGNRTDYEIDSKTGNVTKITKPDGGTVTRSYDKWNNVIKEVNEAGNKTFYKYDSTGSKLLLKVQPVNGKDEYDYSDNPDTAKYAVTRYVYYSKADARSKFNCNVDGLLQSEIDPEGNSTVYGYNPYGDIASITDAAGNTTTKTYNNIGQELSETTAKGNTTKFNYDKNGLVIREIHPDGGIKRTIYDAAGYKSLEVNPNQYDSSKDNTTTGAYSGTIGTSYKWYDNGNLKSVTDAEGNITSYTYDIFGNKKTETKPSGAIYRYEYDSLDRQTKTYYKENASTSEVILNETGYSIQNNGNTQANETSYADDTTKSTTTTVKDYADREVEKWNADGTREKTLYNTDGTVNQKIAANGAITYFNYDAFGNVTNVLAPIAIEDGYTKYAWTRYSYDKAGNVTEERKGKNLVTMDETKTQDYSNREYYSQNYTYSKGLLAQKTDTDGRKTDYLYDKEERVSQETDKVSATETQVTATEYNYLGKPTTVTKKVRTGDIDGNDYSDNSSKDVTESYRYDVDGNVSTYTDPEGHMTSNTYDKLDRVTKIENIGTGIVVATTSKTYNWDGQTASETDRRGNKTSYTYDNAGNQIKVTDAKGNVTLKSYDRMGRNTAVVSPKNYVPGTAMNTMERTEFVYDAMNRVLKQNEIYKRMNRDSAFHWTSDMVNITTKAYQYDDLGNVISTTDALGNVSTTDYNLAGMQESVTDAQTKEDGIDFTTEYSYNGLGQKVKEVYPNAAYYYTYDGAGNLLSTSVNGVVKQTISYDFLGRAVSTKDGQGNVTTQAWNALNQLSKTVTPGDSTIPANTTIYQYDTCGNLKYMKDSLGAVTTNTYDFFGRELSKKVSDASGNQSITTSKTYDNNGNILTETDGRGNTTTDTYDELNRKVTSTNPRKQTTTYAYDANGNQTGVTDYLGNTTHKTYDGINRLIEEKDAGNNIVQQILYNDADAQTSSFDALGNETKFLYDKNLRQIGTIDGNGHASSMKYDTRGNITSKTDGNGNTTTYAYDGENNLTSVKDALGNITAYTYDNNGNVLTQKDGNGNVTTYTYNAANKMTAKIDPASSGIPGLSETYTYYPNGQMASKKDRNNVITGYTYDIFGRLTEENAGGEKQSYTYDGNGNTLTMTDASGTTTRTYDALNRNTKKTVPGIGTSTYDYDLSTGTAGEYMEQTTDPKGNITKKTYDNMGRLSKVTAGNETTGYEYYRNGRQYRVTYPNQTTETYLYDADNQITKLVNAKSDGSVLSSYDYTYDAAGNQTSKTDAKGKTSYSYDRLNRLSTVTEPITVNNTSASKLTSYTYDGAGNRKSEKIQIGDSYTTTLYSYNALNRLTSTLSSNGDETHYTYDNNGNLLSKTTGTSAMKTLANTNDSQTETISTKDELPSFNLVVRRSSENGTGTKDLAQYRYDKYNRLITMKDEDTTASYTYNAQGYRVEKTINGTTTDYLYEGDKVVLETDKSNNQKAVQVYGNSLLTRSVAGSSGTGAEKYFYLYNAHGDVTSLINPAGGVAASYDYDAFGNIINKTGSANNSTLYAGYQHDDESGLYYLNARYYDSVTARFITEDTYTGQANDPLSLNYYTYCHNEPIMYYDFNGNKEYTMTLYGTIETFDVSNKGLKNLKKCGWQTYKGQELGYETINITGRPNTVNVGSETNTVNISKDGNVQYLNTAKRSTLTINNNGNIWQINTGDNSYTTVYNTGNINMYCAGVNSQSYITNYENIGQINTRMKSDLYINNTGNIGHIYNGRNSKCYIGYSKKGYIGKVAGGHVEKLNVVDTFISRLGTGVVFNMERWSKAVERNPNGYLTEQITNLYALCKMSTFDIAMNTGESIDVWFQKFMTADKYKKTDMAADLIAQGIRINGFSVAISEVSKVLKGSVIKGAGKAGLPTEAELNGAVSEWSKMQKSLAPSKTQAAKFNTGTVVYDASTGEYYYGMNRGVKISGDTLNPTLSKMLPEKSLNNYKLGNCAEVDAVNQALNNGANMKDLYMYTIDVNSGAAKGMCSNCSYTFNGNVANVLSK